MRGTRVHRFDTPSIWKLFQAQLYEMVVWSLQAILHNTPVIFFVCESYYQFSPLRTPEVGRDIRFSLKYDAKQHQ